MAEESGGSRGQPVFWSDRPTEGRVYQPYQGGRTERVHVHLRYIVLPWHWVTQVSDLIRGQSVNRPNYQPPEKHWIDCYFNCVYLYSRPTEFLPVISKHLPTPVVVIAGQGQGTELGHPHCKRNQQPRSSNYATIYLEERGSKRTFKLWSGSQRHKSTTDIEGDAKLQFVGLSTIFEQLADFATHLKNLCNTTVVG